MTKVTKKMQVMGKYRKIAILEGMTQNTASCRKLFKVPRYILIVTCNQT